MSGKRKLQQFAEIKTFSNVIEVPYDDVFGKDHSLKGNWSTQFFKNDRPIILELGCGKGEYTVGMARHNPDKNFIGIDIKGARMWRGAKTALEEGMTNVCFLRTRIEFIESFFASNEISEIWVTFPDPQPQLKREKKRLTSPIFLKKYKNILSKEGLIHLKTDARSLYDYTLEVVEGENLKILSSTSDLYTDLPKLQVEEVEKEILAIPTFYEQKFSKKGHLICYLKLTDAT